MQMFSQYMFNPECFDVRQTKTNERSDGAASRAPRALSISVPKSGTNHLQRILMLQPGLNRAWLPTIDRRKRGTGQNQLALLTFIKKNKINLSPLDYLGLPLSGKDACRTAGTLCFGPPQTFRVGRIQNLEMLFNQKFKDASQAIAGNFLIDLGCETGMDW
jgi:hypothetical protein